MPTKPATIDHPRRKGDVPLGAHRSFAAYGQMGETSSGQNRKKVRCYLLNPKGNRVSIGYPIALPPDGTFWAAAFTKVPVGKGYALELVDATSDERIAYKDGLDFKGTYGTSVTCPPTDGKVCCQGFVANGPTDNIVSGGKMTDGTNTFLGTATQVGNTWWIPFPGLTVSGNPYTFTVDDDTASPASTTNNITVLDAGNCGQATC